MGSLHLLHLYLRYGLYQLSVLIDILPYIIRYKTQWKYRNFRYTFIHTWQIIDLTIVYMIDKLISYWSIFFVILGEFHHHSHLEYGSCFLVISIDWLGKISIWGIDSPLVLIHNETNITSILTSPIFHNTLFFSHISWDAYSICFQHL